MVYIPQEINVISNYLMQLEINLCSCHQIIVQRFLIKLRLRTLCLMLHNVMLCYVMFDKPEQTLIFYKKYNAAFSMLVIS